MADAKLVKFLRRPLISEAQAEALREEPELARLPPDARAEVDNLLHRLSRGAEPRRPWLMIYPEQNLWVVARITELPRPKVTARVWAACWQFLNWDSGEVLADRSTIAAAAGTTPRDVSRAFGELVKLGALFREDRAGRATYRINPDVGWRGSEESRLEVGQHAPALRVVE